MPALPSRLVFLLAAAGLLFACRTPQRGAGALAVSPLYNPAVTPLYLGVDGPHLKAARGVEKSFADAKKPLPINVDGAIGAILADLGMNPAAFNGIFMIARTPGLVAHVLEEQTREKPMRRIDPVNHGYDGPAARSVGTTTNEHQ